MLWYLSANAQKPVLTGRVYDKSTGNPLTRAEVFLSKTECGTTTDKDGRFRLECKKMNPDNTLVINFLGYKKYFIRLTDYKNASKIYLEPQSLDFGDEIVVRAEKIDITKQDIPLAKNVIEFKEIERYGSSEISDILKPLPSIRIEGNDLDGRRIQIRGSDPDEVNVYLDGILINNVRFDNAADLSIIPVESIENLEILRGGNSAFLGNGAFGGVVNITTRHKDKPSFFIKGKMGSFNSKYLIGELNLPITKKFVVSYFGQMNNLSPNIEYFSSEQHQAEKLENDQIDTKKQNHNLNLSYFLENAQINTRFIGYYFKYDKPFWESEYRNYLSAASYKGQLLGMKDFDILISHLPSRNKFSRNPVGSSRYISSYITNRLNTRIAKKFVYKSGEIQLLSEYYHDDLLTDSKVKDINWESELYHGFLYDNRVSFAGVISFNDYLKNLPIVSWKTYLGLRGDVLSNGDKDITQMAGVQINYSMEKWKFSPYFNYGKNVKYPTLEENAYITDLTNITRTDTTQDRLEPEFSSSIEAGITTKYFPGSAFYRSFEFSFALFSRTIYNKLLTRPFDDVIANVQLGRNVTRGVETSLKFNELFRWFTFNVSFVQLDITNPFLYAYKPKKNMSLHLSYVSHFGLYATSTFFYEGKSLAWYYDTDNQFQTETIEPFNDMDISIGYRIPVIRTTEIDFQISGYNIFDSSGFRYYYLKKRYWQISLAIRY